MHIPDGFLDPKTSTGLGLAAAACLSYAFNKVSNIVLEKVPQRVAVGVSKAFSGFAEKTGNRISQKGRTYLLRLSIVFLMIFIVQRFDFPVLNGSTGHLIGSFLSVLLLGPFGGTIAMALVLLSQAFFLSDGGILALGANIVNMAVIGGAVSYYIYYLLRKVIKSEIAILISAWLSVVLAAFAFSIEVGLSTFSLSKEVGAMIPVHVIIGAAEALITLASFKIISQILAWKED